MTQRMTDREDVWTLALAGAHPSTLPSSIAGAVGQLRGRLNEERIRDLLLGATPWIMSVRCTDPFSTEDQAGIDIVVTTDVGQLGLQVKSNGSGAMKWRRRHANTKALVDVVVVSPEMPDDQALLAAISTLTKLRDRAKDKR